MGDMWSRGPATLPRGGGPNNPPQTPQTESNPEGGLTPRVLGEIAVGNGLDAGKGDKIPPPQSPGDGGFDFCDLKPITIPVKNLLGRDYILRDASPDTAIKYREAKFSAIQFGADHTPVGIKGGIDAEAILLAGCLFLLSKQPGPNGIFMEVSQPLTPEYVRNGDNIPYPAFKKLVERAKEISQLDEKPETKEDLELEISRLQERLRQMGKETSLPKGPQPATPGSSS